MIKKLRSAWKLDEHAVALERLRGLAAQLDRSHPAAAFVARGSRGNTDAAAARDRGTLKTTLASTNQCESMVRHEVPCERRGGMWATLIRAGCDGGPGLTQRPGEARGRGGAGSPTDGGSSPDDVAAGAVLPDGPSARKRNRKAERTKRWLKPLDRIERPETWRIRRPQQKRRRCRSASRAGSGSSIRVWWPEGSCDCPPDVLQG
jgi:hypothetical protein